MPWYRCLVRGENFPVRMGEGGGFVLCGFYTTRWVEAVSPEAAETAALRMLRSEDIFVRPEEYDQPLSAKVYFEEIVEVAESQNQGGATWFPMDDSDRG